MDKDIIAKVCIILLDVLLFLILWNNLMRDIINTGRNIIIYPIKTIVIL